MALSLTEEITGVLLLGDSGGLQAGHLAERTKKWSSPRRYGCFGACLRWPGMPIDGAGALKDVKYFDIEQKHLALLTESLFVNR